MPRRNRRQGRGPAPSPGIGRPAAFEPGPAGDPDGYHVRQVPPARAVKEYRCPGCDHPIAVGMAHVVAWPDRPGGDDERRHWHRGCWGGRGSRGVTRRWS